MGATIDSRALTLVGNLSSLASIWRLVGSLLDGTSSVRLDAFTGRLPSVGASGVTDGLLCGALSVLGVTCGDGGGGLGLVGDVSGRVVGGHLLLVVFLLVWRSRAVEADGGGGEQQSARGKVGGSRCVSGSVEPRKRRHGAATRAKQ